MSNRRIRRSQLITQFGVGAIIEIGNESFIAKDLSFEPWSGIFKSETFHLARMPRLENLLGIKFIVKPPDAPTNRYSNMENAFKLPYMRFPEWLICRECDGLNQYSNEDSLIDEPSCKSCYADYKNLQPVRWIYASKDGYLADISWSYLLHDCYENNPCRENSLIFRSKESTSGGLTSLEISCKSCSSKKTLQQISAMAHRQKPPTYHPWQGGESWSQHTKNNRSSSSRTHQVFQQRGATSLYQSLTISALDLAGSKHEQITHNISPQEEWINQYGNLPSIKQTINDAIRTLNNGDFAENRRSYLKNIVDRWNQTLPTHLDSISIEAVEEILDRQDADTNLDNVDYKNINDESLLFPEWEILNGEGHQEYLNYDGNKLFVEDESMSIFIESISSIKKLREVRVLYGFTRYFDVSNVHPMYMGKPEWNPGYLPGTEVFGEGIFIQFKIDKIKSWINLESKSLHNRLQSMVKRREELERNLPHPSPEFVLVHTFSHLLMNQLCFESGYSMSSVREKLYIDLDKGMMGVLIYTADADSEGALGGLVRMGQEHRLIYSIKSMLDSARWCSSDPACLELGSPGTLGLNKAACHSCSLIPETSCPHFNSLLDRAMLIGSDEDNLKGFFSELKI